MKHKVEDVIDALTDLPEPEPGQVIALIIEPTNPTANQRIPYIELKARYYWAGSKQVLRWCHGGHTVDNILTSFNTGFTHHLIELNEITGEPEVYL